VKDHGQVWLSPRFIRQFHEGMMAQVIDDGETSEPFPVTNGVKQGCVLATTILSMLLSAMLADAFNDNDPGFDFKYRTSGKLFSRLRRRSKLTGFAISCLPMSVH
jgi:hypothetical protein